jgi:hypothetical protein
LEGINTFLKAMSKRKRTKMSGLISHTNPDGRSYVSHRERCSNNIHRLESLINEGYRIVGSTKRTKEPKEVIVSVFGGKVKMTFTEYQQRGNGLKVLMEIF